MVHGVFAAAHIEGVAVGEEGDAAPLLYQVLGDNEIHMAVATEDIEAARAFHRELGCICYENPNMGKFKGGELLPEVDLPHPRRPDKALQLLEQAGAWIRWK